MGCRPHGVTGREASEAGSVLVIVLLVITVLSLLGVTFLTLSMTESSIALNENRLGQAFYLAEAGIAEAQRILRADPDSNWNDLLANPPILRSCPSSVVAALSNPAPGDGCTFTIENDPQDPRCTPVPQPDCATNDTNNTVLVKATGQYQTAAKQVEAAITRLTLPVPPGGVTSVGVTTNVSFAGNSFEIDGNNWIPPSDDGSTPASKNNGACTGTCPKFGIAVPTVIQQQEVKNDLNSQQMDNVTGAPPNPPWSPLSDTPSIGVDATVTQAQLEQLVDRLIPLADLKYNPGTSISGGTLGTQASPKIVVVDASGSSANPALTLSATKGAGILIVKNGSLRITGNSTWVGAIIVIGSNVSIDLRGGGGGERSIYGSLFLAENLQVQAPDAEGEGNVKIRFSEQGIRVANSVGGGKLRGATLWWKEVY